MSETVLKGAPRESLREIDPSMSNFDFTVDDGVEEQLRAGGTFANYAGWNFHGQVWFDGERFRCYVMQYRAHVDTICADTLVDLMRAVSDKFGYD